MEYCPNGNLRDFISVKGRLSEEECKNIIFQVAQGLTSIHNKGIAHGDIKPENILLDKNQKAKLIDFGLSQKIYSKGENSFSMFQGGTFYYIPPEIMLQKSYDYKIDSWALGVTLFEMLTGGARPFTQSLSSPDLYNNNHKSTSLELELNFDAMDHCSFDAKELVRNLLSLDPKARMSIREIKNSNWIRKGRIDLPDSDALLLGKRDISQLLS